MNEVNLLETEYDEIRMKYLLIDFVQAIFRQGFLVDWVLL